jgi:AcrR family transcriptional regulator
MLQQDRSGRSRRLILDSALKLFSKQGYRGTSTREIAEAAGLSTGNVYHLFEDKESVFRALLERYFAILAAPEFPFNKALAAGAFPDDLEALGKASRESVRKYKSYVALIYVDVVEFDGKHIRRYYAEMARRFESFMAIPPGETAIRSKLRPGVSPVAAIMLASRFFLHYYAVEIVFGVKDHFGKNSDDVLKEIAEILRHGMLEA